MAFRSTRSLQLYRLFTATFSALGWGAMAAGLSGCLLGKAEICGDRLPKFDSRLAGAILELAPGRGIASEAPDGLPQREFNKAYWLRWGEDRLVEAQSYLDLVEDAQDLLTLRQELSDMATAFVSFHGYARLAKPDRMVRVLESIQARSTRVRQLACPAAGKET